jgi:hypothetical protein
MIPGRSILECGEFNPWGRLTRFMVDIFAPAPHFIDDIDFVEGIRFIPGNP